MSDPISASKQQGSQENNETLASSVYQQLLDDIIAGRLEPGRKLRLQDLKDNYAVGNSPLREALNRLTTNGMVVREENRGFRVSPATEEELLELIRTRCWLEEIALRESISHGDEDWEERIVLAFHWLSRLAQSGNTPSFYSSPEWEQHHREYHLSLLSACNSKILLDFCAQLQDQTLRYRNLAAVVKYRERHELEEHQAIQNAVLKKDADVAVDLLIAHYKVTADIVISSGSLKK